MLKRVLVFAVLVSMPLPAFAQDGGFKFSSLTVSSGEDPISSGITGIVRFENERNRLLEVAIQQEQAWLVYGWKFNSGRVKGMLGATVGHFQGAPWAGPLLTMNAPLGTVAGRSVSVRTMHWPGVFPWEPRDWKTENDWLQNPEKLYKGYIGNVGLDVGPVGLTYSRQNFLDDPWNTLLGVSYTAAVEKNFSLTGSGTWNSNAEKWMFYAGLTWKPQSGGP